MYTIESSLTYQSAVNYWCCSNPGSIQRARGRDGLCVCAAAALGRQQQPAGPRGAALHWGCQPREELPHVRRSGVDRKVSQPFDCFLDDFVSVLLLANKFNKYQIHFVEENNHQICLYFCCQLQ